MHLHSRGDWSLLAYTLSLITVGLTSLHHKPQLKFRQKPTSGQLSCTGSLTMIEAAVGKSPS